MFLRKQLSEAARPESRMRSRVARRGKLQRDDYVVRMLRISRSFVVISGAKWREIIHQNHFKTALVSRTVFAIIFIFMTLHSVIQIDGFTLIAKSTSWLHYRTRHVHTANSPRFDPRRRTWDEDFKHRRTVAVHIIRPMDGNIIQPDTDSHDFVLLLQQARLR